MRDAFKATGLNVLTFKVDHHQLTDSGIHPVNCNHGHEFVIIFSGAKFEVLFDIGMNAINDGYAREAVSSFTSSLERFYEFFISYSAHKNQIDDSIYEIFQINQRDSLALIYLHIFLNIKKLRFY